MAMDILYTIVSCQKIGRLFDDENVDVEQESTTRQERLHTSSSPCFVDSASYENYFWRQRCGYRYDVK